MDQFVHPCTKANWLIILVAICWWFLPGNSIQINAYQAEGGICWKTWALGWGCCALSGLCWEFFYFTLFLSGILVLCIWGFAIYHGYLVMQKSK